MKNTINLSEENIDELIKHDVFINYVKNNISELVKGRKIRVNAPSGFYYKRDWFDIMYDNRQLTSAFFLQNIKDIWYKKSNLSSNIRKVIKYVCDKSLTETINFHAGSLKE